MSKPVAFAVAAHPDDIEFMMAGTLLMLGRAGYELHMMNVANGSCGSATMDRETTIATRLGEARDAAKTLGATLHDPIADDLEVFYCKDLLRKLGAVVREVRPTIVLTHPPQDYMEDHMNACRLAVSTVFARGMRNFETDPLREPVEGEVTIYHALPYGLRDGIRQAAQPDHYVDITSVLAQKRAALACHRSQKEWLDHSQGLDSYLNTMEDMSAEVGRRSGAYSYAEGWRQHLHLGLCAPASDPLAETLRKDTIRLTV